MLPEDCACTTGITMLLLKRLCGTLFYVPGHHCYWTAVARRATTEQRLLFVASNVGSDLCMVAQRQNDDTTTMAYDITPMTNVTDDFCRPL
jgi:hypothetical protein